MICNTLSCSSAVTDYFRVLFEAHISTSLTWVIEGNYGFTIVVLNPSQWIMCVIEEMRRMREMIVTLYLTKKSHPIENTNPHVPTPALVQLAFSLQHGDIPAGSTTFFQLPFLQLLSGF